MGEGKMLEVKIDAQRITEIVISIAMGISFQLINKKGRGEEGKEGKFPQLKQLNINGVTRRIDIMFK